MKTESFDKEELRFISRKEKYPRGANSPTVITKYSCPCGKGKTITRDTPGFNDCFTTLKCRRCLKKYHPFVDVSGWDFVFYLKDDT